MSDRRTAALPARPWGPVLAAGQAEAAVQVARAVAARLADRHRVAEACAAAAAQTGHPGSVYWQPYGVAQGAAGLALACSYLDACLPGAGWDMVGHRWLEEAARGAERSPRLPLGLFAGVSGLSYAALSLSRGGTRYRRLLANLSGVLLPGTMAAAGQLSGWRAGGPVHGFDVISGLAGVGRYLLCRREDPAHLEALHAVLHSLVELTREDGGVPRWHTPVAHLRAEQHRHFPHGQLNCGLAHGIPGPLALMALALGAGVAVEGLEEAVDRVAGWLARQRLDDPWGVNWPVAVPLGPAGAPGPVPAPGGPGRAAWCYGAPGIARTLWLAGEALDHSGYRELAVEAMAAVYRRPQAARRIDSPTFCHGVAGLLQITLRFAHDTGMPLFTEAARALGTQLLELYEPDSLLGYRNREAADRHVDQPGLLEGAPGVALVLLAAATAEEPAWDRIFLIS